MIHLDLSWAQGSRRAFASMSPEVWPPGAPALPCRTNTSLEEPRFSEQCLGPSMHRRFGHFLFSSITRDVAGISKLQDTEGRPLLGRFGLWKLLSLQTTREHLQPRPDSLLLAPSLCLTPLICLASCLSHSISPSRPSSPDHTCLVVSFLLLL